MARERRWWTLAVLCMSLVIVGLDNMILNTALPTLVRDLRATTSELQWIIDSYIIVLAGLLITAGSLGDRFGRRGALTAGLVVFGGASAAAAWSSSAVQLIVCRALMGVGAALIMPATLSILTNVFTEPTERGRAIGVWAGVSSVGIAVGPVAGGFLLDRFWWGSVFLINIPVVVAALVLGRWLVPTSKDPSAPRVDYAGAVLSMAGLSVLLWAIIGAPDRGWGDPVTIGAFLAAGTVIGAFVAWELHCDEPMLDLSVFRRARFSAASLSITLALFAMAGEIFVLTQFLQFVLGYSPLEAGLRVAPVAVVMMVVGPLSPRLVERFGSKSVVTFGLVTSAVGLALLAGTQVDSGYSYVFVAIVVITAGAALSIAPATESIMGSISREKAGVGSAVNTTTRQVGSALGVAVIGGLLVSGYHSALDERAASLGLSGDALAAARSSVGAALRVAGQVGGQAGAAIADGANQSFVHGLHLALWVSAAVCLAGALLALVFLPARAPHHDLDATEYLPVDYVVDLDEFDVDTADARAATPPSM